MRYQVPLPLQGVPKEDCCLTPPAGVQDGVLKVSADSLCILFDSDGKSCSQSKMKGCLDLEPSAEIMMGGWELEIDVLLPEDEFLSGRAFEVSWSYTLHSHATCHL
jgi:hypothetical protein